MEIHGPRALDLLPSEQLETMARELGVDSRWLNRRELVMAIWNRQLENARAKVAELKKKYNALDRR